MKSLVASTRFVWRWMLRFGLVLGLLIALALPLGRWLLPELADYRETLEQNLGAYLHAPVQIQELKTRWRGWEPLLSLQGFRLLDPHQGTILASFEHALLSLDPLASLLSGRPILNHVRLEGLHLQLDRTGGLRLPDRDTNAAIPLPDLLPWLFRIRSLDLLAETIQFQGIDGKIDTFRDLRLSLRNQGHKHRLGMTLKLSESSDDQLRATLEATGEPHDPSSWIIRYYLQGDELPLAKLPLPVMFAQGRMTTELWGSWRQQAFQEAFGRIRFHDPDFAHAPPAAFPALPDGSGQFHWRRDGQGWQWQSDWQIGQVNESSPLHTTVDLTATSEQTTQYLYGRVGHLPVKNLIALTTPWLDTRQRNLLADLEPSGEIPELTFRLREPFTPSNFPDAFNLTARFQELATRARGNLPGLAGLSGRLTWGSGTGRLDLTSSELRITAPAWLRRTIAFDYLRGSLYWQRQAAGWQLETPAIELGNKHLTAQLQGNLTLVEDRRSPLLDLQLHYQNVDIGQVHRYLPASRLQPKLVTWLDQALVKGRATGDLIFRGHPEDFPFTRDQGLFETRFRVTDTILDYRPDWPRIEALEAEAIFRNDTLVVQATDGRIFDTRLTGVQARIDNLAKAVLEIQGSAQGRGETFLRFLRESPLRHTVGGYVADMWITGDNTLALDLTIPLDPRPPRVRGTVGFTGGNVDLPAWQIALNRIRGTLDFTHDGLAAENIQLLFQGEPARLDIMTRQNQDGRRETRFTLQGRFNPRTLLGQYGTAIDPYLKGKSRWQAVLAIPAVPPGTPMTFSLNLQSNLQGVAVELPAPLGKSPPETRSLTADARFDAKHTLRLHLNYGSDVQAALAFLDFPARPRFGQGELRINTGPARLPGTPGLTLAIRLPHYEFSSLEETTTIPNFALFPPWLTAADVQLGKLVIGPQEFSQFVLQARQKDQVLAVTLDSAELTGRLTIPMIPSPEKPVEVNLERLALAQGAGIEKTANRALDPRLLPPLWITIDELVLADRLLGQLRLSLLPRSKGIKLDNLVLHSKRHRLTAAGDWIIGDQGPLSRLHARLHSTDLGKTLTAFGIDSAISGGETEAEFKGEWAAGFTQMSPEKLRGQLNLRINKGQLLDVEPGIGRMLGLFNINSLSRRLNLDFRDVYEKGMGFDSIAGHFTFENGHTYTDDLTILAPSANILVQGQVDLENKKYNHLITVIPQLGMPLTIAGTIAGGPAVGAAVFFAEQALKSEIAQLTRYQYTVTGSWDNPVINRLQGWDNVPEPPFGDNPASPNQRKK